jgi:Ca-activated chloride channel family protein
VILNPTKERGAQEFYTYLLQPARQEVIDRNGFRAASTPRGYVGPNLGGQKFILANEPGLVLSAPQGDVLEAMLFAWQTLRKRARVLILVDAAANSSLLKDATARLADAVSRFNPTDAAGVWLFPAPAGYATPSVVTVSVAKVSNQLTLALSGIAHTADPPDLAASLKAAVDWMARTYDPGAVDAVLLVEMSPGERTTQDQDLEQYLVNQPADRFIHVFTVGPAGPSSLQLTNLAGAGAGIAYQGSANNLLNDVISNF